MRLFMAITLDERIKAALSEVQEGLKEFGKAIRLVREDQMHLTVKFLGEVANGQVSQVTEAVQAIGRRCESVAFGISELGCFPQWAGVRGAGVRVVWAGVQDMGGSLERCYQASEEVFERAGFAREKRGFSAHLTLGRVKDHTISGALREWLEGRAFDAGVQTASQLTLYQSVLSSKGATYNVVTRAKMKPAESGT